jgi:SAM-dependent methyltransferase
MPTGDDGGLTTAELALLWAARETGLLDALLTRVGTAHEAAAMTGVSEHAARTVVDSLVDLGFLHRVGDEVEPTNRALGFLATEDVRSIGRLPHAVDLFDRLRRLPEAMQAGLPPESPADWTRHELGARWAVDDAEVRATVDAIHAAHPDATWALELCGGPGRYATELADRDLEVTLLDGADVVETIGPMLDTDRIHLQPGNFFSISETGYDVVYAVDMAWSLSREESAMLVAAAADALAADGTFVLVEPLRGHSDRAAETSVRALATGVGECYAEADVAGWCFEAGLDDVEVADVPGTAFQAVAARRGR